MTGRDEDFHAELDALTAAADRAIDAAGPRPPPRIVARDGGYEVQDAVLLFTGRWEYQKTCWVGNRPAAERYMKLRS
jgi:hypothetical protein